MLKKCKHKFMAFLLSAMMLITGAAMGTAPAAAAEKSPPALKSCSANFGYGFAISIRHEYRRRVDVRRFPA